MAGELVLVTGGSGFVGSHCIVQLLNAGYHVRTSVRSLSREAEVRQMLRVGGVDAGDRLSFAAADLTSDSGWAAAVAGCTYVHHVASPFPPNIPKHEDEVIIPARDGALRVLKAARDAGVKRVVLTSSYAAIGYGQPQQSAPFDETNWTNPDGDDVRAYVKSKTLAERAAWDFMQREGGALELSVVNPVAILGPVLAPDYSTSIMLIKRLMDGDMPGCPRLFFGIVDVRDVADMHMRCMTHPGAKGERFMAVAGEFLSIAQIARILKRKLGAAAKRVPTMELPDFLVRLAARGDPAVQQILPELGKRKNGTNAKAKSVLGWQPRSNEEAILATAESLAALGLLKDSAKKSGVSVEIR
ncbi:MAG: aldehyde reductase [Phycisphaerales bacterium]|nr:aldehyde reductase [Hyphomonadaceae bacterium]